MLEFRSSPTPIPPFLVSVLSFFILNLITQEAFWGLFLRVRGGGGGCRQIIFIQKITSWIEQDKGKDLSEAIQKAVETELVKHLFVCLFFLDYI